MKDQIYIAVGFMVDIVVIIVFFISIIGGGTTLWVKWIMGDIWESTRTFLNGVLISKRGMQSAKTGIEVGREQNFKPVGRKHQQVFVIWMNTYYIMLSFLPHFETLQRARLQLQDTP